MTVKDKVGRKRYIAFSVDSKFSKDTLISALRSVSAAQPYVIQCGEGWAIVRCMHDSVDETKEAVKRADPKSLPLRTSGTLRTLRSRYPELERLRPVRKV